MEDYEAAVPLEQNLYTFHQDSGNQVDETIQWHGKLQWGWAAWKPAG
jgi:hypothetical protein